MLNNIHRKYAGAIWSLLPQERQRDVLLRIHDALHRLRTGRSVKGFPLFEFDCDVIDTFPERAPPVLVAPFAEFAFRSFGEGIEPYAIQVLSRPPGFTARCPTSLRGYFEVTWDGDIDGPFTVHRVADGVMLPRGAFPEDDDEVRDMAATIRRFVTAGLTLINTHVVVEEVTDNRKPKRRGQPVAEHERKYIQTKFVVLTRKQTRQRWRNAPGNGGKKCPHLRRSHLRRLESGQQVVVRACKVHAEEFAWQEHGKTYRVVELRESDSNRPSLTSSSNPTPARTPTR